MGKKSNTVWFMLAATVVNVVLMFIFFTIGFILITAIFTKWPSAAENSMLTLLLVRKEVPKPIRRFLWKQVCRIT